MARTFAHEESYRGSDFLKKIQSKHLTICGAGTLGSNLADTLCRQGFTLLRVIDMDRVEGHNIATQIFGNGDVGALKVAALKNRLFRDTGAEIETFDKELTTSTIKKFLKGSDLVIDAFDNSKSRRLVTEYCKQEKIEALHSGTFEGYGEIVWNDDYNIPQDAPAGALDVCDYPLARNLAIMVTTILAEEIMDFCLASNPRKKSWSITLKDLAIRDYR